MITKIHRPIYAYAHTGDMRKRKGVNDDPKANLVYDIASPRLHPMPFHLRNLNAPVHAKTSSKENS